MVLLVTHEAEFAKQLTRFLGAQGYPVMLAFQGSEVPSLVTEGNPQLIIVNLYLRNPSGLEVLRQLRTQGYAGKIIVLAGYSTSTEMPRAFYFGVDQVLGQPVSLHHLASAVRVAIGPSVKTRNR
jgi:DNA-binding response OmpR family regulator